MRKARADGAGLFCFVPLAVIASEAKQSISPQKERMDCFVAALLAMTPQDSRRQCVLDQLDPVRRAVDDRLVVEIIGGVMQTGAIAIAAEDEGARAGFQH